MPTLAQTLRDLNYDLNVYKMRLKRPKLAIILLFPGFQALAFYRFERWLKTYRGTERSKKPIWWPVVVLEAILKRFIEIITGIHISPQADIAPGLYMPHFGGIVITEHVVMGRNCVVCHNAGLGYGITGKKDGFPKVGDRVYLAPQAAVIGPIELGDDVLVGVSTVCNRSFPDRAVLLGIPAKLLSRRGSFDFQMYPGMDTDPERLASVALANDPMKPSDPLKPPVTSKNGPTDKVPDPVN